MKTILKTGVLFVAALLLVACKAEYEFSTWPCQFSYDNSIHLDMTLNMAMNPNDPGTFCLIWEETQKGIKYICFKNNKGESSRLPETAEEKNPPFILGLNNGIIIGFTASVLDNNLNFAFMGFDQQCPNCVNRTGNKLNPTYRIEVDEAGIGTCRECKKRYNLNAGGIIINGEEGDKGMEKYAAATQGQNGHVSVHRYN